ncbi:hypothetical protein BD779DRAFT_302302 [Infundibulicybe gibba]|nr:hypothetical protein BD779DRAFT_302302 [Infundibulicybe gibba]
MGVISNVLVLGFTAFSIRSIRAQSIPSKLPGNWTSIGCYTDISTSRTLNAISTNLDDMTIESCIAFCEPGGYIYAGLEFGRVLLRLGTPNTKCPSTCD